MSASSPTRRKPPPRKAGTGAPGTAAFEPLRFDATEAPEIERIVIAYLGDYALTMPSEVPPNVALKIMRTARQRGDQVALMQMLEEVLGGDGYERLSNWPSLTPQNLADLFERVQSVAGQARAATS